jgi:hypothetical protein
VSGYIGLLIPISVQISMVQHFHLTNSAVCKMLNMTALCKGENGKKWTPIQRQQVDADNNCHTAIFSGRNVGISDKNEKCKQEIRLTRGSQQLFSPCCEV